MFILGIGTFPSVGNADMQSSLRQTLKKSSDRVSIDGSEVRLQAIRSFYAGRGYDPIWYTEGGLGERGRAVETLFLKAETE